MLILFDYVYYRFCIFCKNNDEDHPNYPFTAFVILSLFQALNLMTLVLLVSILFKKLLFRGKWDGGIAIFLMYIINFKRYNKIPFETLEKKWESELKRKKVFRGWLIIAYMLGTCVVLILSAIWMNSYERGPGTYPELFK